MNLIEKYPIHIVNSLTGKKEKFTTITPNFVGIYVCGPTVYSHVHLGNCRTFLSFDVMVRYLRYLGYKVRYVRNITDVGHLESDHDSGEDKVAKKARLEQIEPMEVVQQYTLDFHRVMRVFNITPPDIEPTASAHMIEQINAIEQLIKKKLAYVVNGSVYFDVRTYQESYHNYGLLSGRHIDELRESQRVLDNQDEKRDKIDFALWKKASPRHIMRWPSPWSDGFPGWHLECTVMGTKYLGEQFDIHGGGMDLKFPHHECEIAQARGIHGSPLAQYWIHTNMLTVEGKKMSKSMNNSFLPDELFTGKHHLLKQSYSPMSVRFFMLQSHYSSTLDISNEALTAAEKGYKKLMEALRFLKNLSPTRDDTVENQELKAEWSSLISKLYDNMSDNFNSAKTLAVLFEMATYINNIKSGLLPMHKIPSTSFDEFKETYIGFMEEVLGLQEEKTLEQDRVEGIMKMIIRIRSQARHEGNFALSDKIREELKALGIQLKDGKDGTIEHTFL